MPPFGRCNRPLYDAMTSRHSPVAQSHRPFQHARSASASQPRAARLRSRWIGPAIKFALSPAGALGSVLRHFWAHYTSHHLSSSAISMMRQGGWVDCWAMAFARRGPMSQGLTFHRLFRFGDGLARAAMLIYDSGEMGRGLAPQYCLREIQRREAHRRYHLARARIAARSYRSAEAMPPASPMQWPATRESRSAPFLAIGRRRTYADSYAGANLVLRHGVRVTWRPVGAPGFSCHIVIRAEEYSTRRGAEWPTPQE